MYSRRTALLLAAGACTLGAQAPKQLLDQLAPRQPAVTIEYTNPFDQSHSEALVDLPPDLKSPVR